MSGTSPFSHPKGIVVETLAVLNSFAMLLTRRISESPNLMSLPRALIGNFWQAPLPCRTDGRDRTAGAVPWICTSRSSLQSRHTRRCSFMQWGDSPFLFHEPPCMSGDST